MLRSKKGNREIFGAKLLFKTYVFDIESSQSINNVWLPLDFRKFWEFQYLILKIYSVYVFNSSSRTYRCGLVAEIFNGYYLLDVFFEAKKRVFSKVS